MTTSDDVMKRLDTLLERIEPYLPPAVTRMNWQTHWAARWHTHAAGGHLEAIIVKKSIVLADLLGVDTQKQKLDNNTRQFLQGLPANNVLLWGSRGTGKSSLIRALLNEYAEHGLRVIEVDKNDLRFLPAIVAQIAEQPYRFILYCDDLSFDEHDEGYKALKSALDGAIYAAPENTLIYATSNRRHLIAEYAHENNDTRLVDGEIHHGEAVEEKVSLSDRFGLWLSFYPNSQADYLAICQHWIKKIAAEHMANSAWNEEAEHLALRFALTRGNRSGRCAYQFARHWVGAAMLSALKAP
jgi:uncharacterized protein